MSRAAAANPPYTEGFFAGISEGARQSAQQTVPLLCQWISCASVVDVGCGTGAWLRVFKEYGVQDVLGLDGEYVNRNHLEIAAADFCPADLTAPPPLGRQFDLAISLEVAEHLPREAADRFVEYLTRLAPIVLFSAAVPGQGGTYHLNEQWPEYWADRFEQRGFVTLDGLRPKLWRNEKIAWWYAQNMFLYVRRESLAAHAALQEMAGRTDMSRLATVHPRAFAIAKQEIRELEEKLRPENMPLRGTLRALPTILRGALKRRSRR